MTTEEDLITALRMEKTNTATKLADSIMNEVSQQTESSETSDAELLSSQSLTLIIDDGHSQLNTPQTNNEEELCIPREIISYNISKSAFQSELLRPLVIGRFHGEENYYFLRLQFQFQAADGGNNWLSRIQKAKITVLLEDAPLEETGRTRRIRPKRDVKTPGFVKTYPGPGGWQGPIDTTGKGLAKVETLRSGTQCESLVVTITEDANDGHGIPSYLIIPVIVSHHKRRFSMRVTVNAKFGFWRGLLETSVPILGSADEPLFFDPTVLEQKLSDDAKGFGGTKILKWREHLDKVDLQEYSSLENMAS